MKKLSTQTLLKVATAPAVLGFALLSTAAYAQDPQSADESGSEDVIIVTGSLISNPNLERSTPVTATTSDEIELKQSNNAEQILREIPGVVPSIGSAVNNGNGGASFVNLRGLGSNRNIVLLDGNRLVPAELNGRFDLNNVPLALVERVDVLTGGASTTYGADAISGVVNFVTKRDFTGVEASVSEQLTEQGDGEIFRADVVIGADLDSGRGNVVLGIGYQEADPVYQGDRAFSNLQIDSFTGAGGGSGTSVPSRFSNVNVGGVNQITTGCGGADQPACVTTAQGTRQLTNDGTAFRSTAAFDAFNFNPYNIFQTPFKRYNIYSSARYEISDAVEVYSRGIFSKNTVSTIIAPSGSFGLTVSVPLNNPYLTAAQRNAFCAFDTTSGAAYTPLYSPAVCAAAATATGTTDPNYRTVTTVFSRRAVETGPRISDFTTTFFDYRLGLRGSITDTISWDVAGSYGESENTQVQQGYWLNSRVRAAFLDGSVNFFGPQGSITQAMSDQLSANSQVSTKVALSQAQGVVSGDLPFTLPTAADAIGFAAGAEYRTYHASQESDLLSQSGDLGGAGGAAPNIEGGYEVYELFGELILPLVQDMPLVQDLTLEAGIRYSSYSVDAPTSPSYTTTTWKVGGSWTPMDGIKVRGNYSHAVRAPNISELFSPVNTGLTNLSDDPCANLNDNGGLIPGRPVPTGVLRDVCIAQGAPAGVIGTIQVPTAGQANATGGGNLNLVPETSNSYTIGLVLQPAALPGFSMTVDYYNIKVDGAVSTPTPGDAMNACFDAPSTSNPACTIIRRSTITGSLSGDSQEVPGLFLGLSNLGKIATDGVDVTINYRRDLGFAKWALAVVGNWTNKSTFQATPSDVNRDCVGYYSVNCGSLQPEYQWSVRNTFTFGAIDASLLWRHIPKMVQEPLDVIDSGPAYKGPVAALGGGNYDFGVIPAADYFDLSIRADIMENLTLTATVQNLFDKSPAIVGNTIGSTSYNSGNVYPSTYDALGRRYAVSAKIKF